MEKGFPVRPREEAKDKLRFWRSLSRAEKALSILLTLTIPFIHAQVRGDGIGYYAYARSLLIDHNLQFAGDWKKPSEDIMKPGLNGHLLPNPITKTGHLPNHWSVGPAMLWAPFLVVAHFTVTGTKCGTINFVQLTYFITEVPCGSPPLTTATPIGGAK